MQKIRESVARMVEINKYRDCYRRELDKYPFMWDIRTETGIDGKTVFYLHPGRALTEDERAQLQAYGYKLHLNIGVLPFLPQEMERVAYYNQRLEYEKNPKRMRAEQQPNFNDTFTQIPDTWEPCGCVDVLTQRLVYFIRPPNGIFGVTLKLEALKKNGYILFSDGVLPKTPEEKTKLDAYQTKMSLLFDRVREDIFETVNNHIQEYHTKELFCMRLQVFISLDTYFKLKQFGVLCEDFLTYLFRDVDFTFRRNRLIRKDERVAFLMDFNLNKFK